MGLLSLRSSRAYRAGPRNHMCHESGATTWVAGTRAEPVKVAGESDSGRNTTPPPHNRAKSTGSLVSALLPRKSSCVSLSGQRIWEPILLLNHIFAGPHEF